MNIYRIDLKPIVPFFFGTAQYAEWGNKKNYFARSAHFPQQTTLLGMLRYQLLLQNDCIHEEEWKITDEDFATALVGEKSFPNKNYGLIKSLSPVYLKKKDELFYLRNDEADLKSNEEDYFEESTIISQQPEELKALNLLKADHSAPTWKFAPYNGKYGFRKRLVGNKGSSINNMEEAFHTITNPHNNKSLRGTNLAQGYFKERRYMLKDDLSFSCYVALDDLNFKDKKLTFRKNTVRLGGRQSWFSMTIERLENIKRIPQPFSSKEESNQIRLLSDAAVNADYAKHCEVVAASIIPFRNIQTSIAKTKKYHSLSDKGNESGHPAFNKYQYLLSRGSMLRLKEGKKWEDIARDQKLFSTIGYNKIIYV